MEDALDFLNRMAWFCLFVLIVLAVILVADYTGFIQ